MSTPGDYRAMAEECFRWAQHAQTEDKRQAYLDVARTCPLRARACARAREIIEEFSLGSIASPVPYNGVARSPLSCRSCRHRSWSGWGGMEQRDGIVDLGAETGMKRHERGSDRLRSGSKPNSIGATHNHAIGRIRNNIKIF